MITITEQPDSIATMSTTPRMPPVPLSDCWKWCLQPADADTIITPGSHATVTIGFPAVPTVPADGTPLTIWGYDFEVDSTQDFTGNSFKVTTSGLVTALNFVSMLEGNLFFNRACTFGITVPGGDYSVLITWNECREQPRFVSEQMVFTAIDDAGGAGLFSNGTSPEYVDAFRILTRLGRWTDATSVFNPVGKLLGVEVDKQCTTVGEVCVQYNDDAQSQLYTDLPDLTINSFITSIQGGRSLMRLFSLEYGWTYRESCVAKSGTIKKSDIVLGINAAFDVDDPYQMTRYWFDPGNMPPEQFDIPYFLTTQPKKIPLCFESFAWLWLLNNFADTYGAGAYRLTARYIIYKKGVSGVFEIIEEVIMNPATDGSAWYQPVNFNVSPGHVLDIATVTEDELDYYQIQVTGNDVLTPFGVLFNASEYLTFTPQHCCEGEKTDIYFLTPPGGIGTVLVDVVSREVVQDGQEVHLATECGGEREDVARYGGRSMFALRSYEKVSIGVSCPRSDEWRQWMKHLRQSPQHWIRVEGGDGEPIAKKFILEPDTARIFTVGEGIRFEATGYLADIPTQSGNEPPQ